MKRISIYIRKPIIIPLLLLFVLNLNSCYYDIESELYPDGIVCDTADVSFSAQIYPIVSNNCLGCHNQNSSSGNVILESYAEIKIQVENGLFECTVNHADGCSPMPQNNGQLHICDLEAIRAWISDGAPDN